MICSSNSGAILEHQGRVSGSTVSGQNDQLVKIRRNIEEETKCTQITQIMFLLIESK